MFNLKHRARFISILAFVLVPLAMAQADPDEQAAGLARLGLNSETVADLMRYSKDASISSALLAFVISNVGMGLAWQIHSWRDWHLLVLPISMILQASAFALRMVQILGYASGSIPYIVMMIFFKLPPTFYFFFNYLYFHRLVKKLDHKYQRMGASFMFFDQPNAILITLTTMTAIGTSLEAAGSVLKGELLHEISTIPGVGSKLVISGNVLQGGACLGFVLNVVKASGASEALMTRASQFRLSNELQRTDTVLTLVNESSPKEASTTLIFKILFISSGFLVLRCFSKIIISIQNDLSLTTDNLLTLFLDTVPLILSVILYIPFYPSSIYPISRKFDATTRPYVPFFDIPGKRMRAQACKDAEVELAVEERRAEEGIDQEAVERQNSRSGSISYFVSSSTPNLKLKNDWSN